jgi:hypothetical protein
MEKHRGNLDDVIPPEPLGSRVSHFLFLEFGLWALIGVLWLAFEGGVVGLIVLAVVAIVVGFAWRDFGRRAKNPIHAQTREGE